MSLHVYRARDQRATRYVVDFGCDLKGKPLRWTVRNPPRRTLPCSKCHKRRHAANLIVHVYYDGTYYFCRKGKGCKQ